MFCPTYGYIYPWTQTQEISEKVGGGAGGGEFLTYKNVIKKIWKPKNKVKQKLFWGLGNKTFFKNPFEDINA